MNTAMWYLLYAQGPFRSPKWRHDRVVTMVRHRPEPLRSTRYDDPFVRSYKRMLIEEAATLNGQLVPYPASETYPALWQAHSLYFSSDLQSRQILEAWILSGAPFPEIAARYGVAAEAIELFEKLFFNCLDRMDRRDWIIKTIRGTTISGSAAAAEQRGYMFRLVAFSGGPLVFGEFLSALSASAETSSGPANERAAVALDMDRVSKAQALMAIGTLALTPENATLLVKLARQLEFRKQKD